MPDERFIHPGEGESDKLTQLSDFEFRVWIAYKLAANDVGVLVDSPVSVQNVSRYLRNKPPDEVRLALDTMLRIELLIRFRHGGEHYLCSPLWQDWQMVKYPRATHLPLPDQAVRARCSDVTQMLFELLESKRKAKRERLLKDSEPHHAPLENISESFKEHSLASHENSLQARPGNANALANANAVEGEPEREAPPPAVDPHRPLYTPLPRNTAWPGRPPVPGFLHQELLQRLSPGETVSDLQAFYVRTSDAWADKAIGDDSIKFWRARFNEWKGTTVKPSAQPQQEHERLTRPPDAATTKARMAALKGEAVRG